MSVYRHKKSPYWQFDFQIKGYRFSGSTDVPRTHPKRDATAFEDAEKAKARILIDRIAASGDQPLTIQRACERWWNEHGQHLGDAAIKTRLDWLVAQIGPKTLLHAITDDTVSKLVEARRTHLRTAGRVQDADGKVTQLYRPITANTVNKTTIVLLRRVLRRARDNWNVVILKEPVWKKHALKETKFRIRELMPSEETTLDEIEDADFADLRRLAIITGLRRGNVLLKKTQVNFENATIAIISKGGVPRILPLTREAYAILWRRQNHHPEVFFTFVAQRTRKCPKTGVDFVKGERYPITYYGMGSNKRKWLKAGVDARIHDLRHTTGMRTLRTTGNLKVVQKILGHSDIAITAKFYTDATVDDMRAAMESTNAASPAPIERKKEGEA